MTIPTIMNPIVTQHLILSPTVTSHPDKPPDRTLATVLKCSVPRIISITLVLYLTGITTEIV